MTGVNKNLLVNVDFDDNNPNSPHTDDKLWFLDVSSKVLHFFNNLIPKYFRELLNLLFETRVMGKPVIQMFLGDAITDDIVYPTEENERIEFLGQFLGGLLINLELVYRVYWPNESTWDSSKGDFPESVEEQFKVFIDNIQDEEVLRFVYILQSAILPCFLEQPTSDYIQVSSLPNEISNVTTMLKFLDFMFPCTTTGDWDSLYNVIQALEQGNFKKPLPCENDNSVLCCRGEKGPIPWYKNFAFYFLLFCNLFILSLLVAHNMKKRVLRVFVCLLVAFIITFTIYYIVNMSTKKKCSGFNFKPGTVYRTKFVVPRIARQTFKSLENISSLNGTVSLDTNNNMTISYYQKNNNGETTDSMVFPHNKYTFDEERCKIHVDLCDEKCLDNFGCTERSDDTIQAYLKQFNIVLDPDIDVLPNGTIRVTAKFTNGILSIPLHVISYPESYGLIKKYHKDICGNCVLSDIDDGCGYANTNTNTNTIE
jgi:hypothetical protein